MRSSRLRTVASLAILAALLAPQAALAAPGQQETTASDPNLWPLLAGIAAAAFAIERVMELLWNFVEWLLLSGGRWQAANLRTAHYQKFKSGASVLLGAVLGVATANALNLHLFAALEYQAPAFALDVPANWDLVVTGLIIGVTAKPLHDLIGLLAETKNFMASAAIRQREAAGAALADGVLKLAQSEAENMVDVPGMGLTRLTDDSMGGETPAASTEQSPTDRYIDLLHNRTLM
jgi:hypothetical protein